MVFDARFPQIFRTTIRQHVESEQRVVTFGLRNVFYTKSHMNYCKNSSATELQLKFVIYRFSTYLHEKLFTLKRYLHNFRPRYHINAYVILEDGESVGGNSYLQFFIRRILYREVKRKMDKFDRNSRDAKNTSGTKL